MYVICWGVMDINIQFMRNGWIFMIFLIVVVGSVQTSLPASPSHHQRDSADQLNEAEVKKEISMENIEIEVKSKEEKQMWDEMKEWVQAETKDNYQNAVPDSLNGENFLFQILRGKQREFVLPNNKVYPLNILVKVFQYSEGGLIIPHEPSKDSHINLTVSGKGGVTHHNSVIYLKKNIRIEGKDSIYRIKMVNNYPKDMILRISLQKKSNLISSINDTKIDPFTTKMKHVLEEIEAGIDEKRMLFKSQMGFMEQEKEQHSNMLILTALELFALIAAALVQLFYLKSLIDNKTFV